VFRGHEQARIDDKGRLKVPNVFRTLLESKYGQAAELDAQGRVLVPARLRDTATISGDVDVLGQYSYLDVWNHDRFLTKLQRDPFTDDDARALAEFGI
jgi:DNA-binding transcriptional regulator/RsmH inhibitor MraZ